MHNTGSTPKVTWHVYTPDRHAAGYNKENRTQHRTASTQQRDL